MDTKVISLKVTTVLLLSVVGPSSGSLLFSSLQFTRDTLMGFSQGSERTVEILTPKKTTKTLTPLEQYLESLDRYYGVQNSLDSTEPLPTMPTKPVTRTVIKYEKEQKTYAPRISPSNKFLEAINDIERAVARAKASRFRYSEAIFSKLKGLLVRAIRSKSYKYAREILGKIMYLLSTKTSPPGRSKRTTPGNEGSNFLQDLRKQLGNSTFDSFMAVQGDVSLMFAIDDTGSMSEEIQAAKNIAIDIIRYPRKAPVKKYILSPFNDPYPGK